MIEFIASFVKEASKARTLFFGNLPLQNNQKFKPLVTDGSDYLTDSVLKTLALDVFGIMFLTVFILYDRLTQHGTHNETLTNGLATKFALIR